MSNSLRQVINTNCTFSLPCPLTRCSTATSLSTPKLAYITSNRNLKFLAKISPFWAAWTLFFPGNKPVRPCRCAKNVFDVGQCNQLKRHRVRQLAARSVMRSSYNLRQIIENNWKAYTGPKALITVTVYSRCINSTRSLSQSVDFL